MKLWHARLGRWFAIRNPILFFAQDRELAELALPGDIIGIPNHGTLRVGDALTEGEDVRFTGIPNFAPEVLREVHLEDPIRAKPLRRALQDLAEEGIAQVFKPHLASRWIVGVVGPLQLDVLESRLAAEYKIAVRFDPSPFTTLRWIEADDAALLTRFIDRHQGSVALDREGAPVFLAADGWALRSLAHEWPGIRLLTTRERS
jgi:peptide chain release factor 3